MTRRSGFARKMLYLLALALLLLPLFWLGQPETPTSPGGKLAQLRHEHQISQATLGEIDPAGETIKLATLGMRNIAANLLWERANYYKKVEDWTSLAATADQITRLQPNFVTVWRFQSWNIAYNVSVEFDDFQDRYLWVKKGIEYLTRGTQYNAKETRLLWDLGWFIAQKIGRSDEHRQFRELFRKDDAYHGDRPREARDNWLVGKEKFKQGQDLVDSGVRLRGLGPALFHSDPAMCQMNYSTALEEEGTFGEKARLAWAKAFDEWVAFGQRDLPTSEGLLVRLGDMEAQQAEAQAAREELYALAPPGVVDELRAARIANLPDDQKKALDTPEDQRTDEQRALVAYAELKLKLPPHEVAQRIEGEKRQRALQLAETIAQAAIKANQIDLLRDPVNFLYWRLRSESERTPEAVEAREAIYRADEALKELRVDQAPKLYEEGFAKWRLVLDRFPKLKEESIDMEDLGEAIERYFELLDKIQSPPPDDFPLADVRAIAAEQRGHKSGKPVPATTDVPKPGESAQ